MSSFSWLPARSYYLLYEIQNTARLRQRSLAEGLGQGLELLDDLLRLRDLRVRAESGGTLRDSAVFKTPGFVGLKMKETKKIGLKSAFLLKIITPSWI